MLGKKRTLVAALVVLVAVPCFAATIEEVEKELTAATKKIKSAKGTVKMDMSGSFQGIEVSSISESTIELLRDGETFMSRNEGTVKSVQKMAGNEVKHDAKFLTICDGKFTYSLSESEGQKNATKSKATNPMDLPWSNYKNNPELKVLPDEKVAGAECFVVEMKVDQGMPGMSMDKMVFYCRKDCGMMVKNIGYLPDGKVLMTSELTNFELNASVPASRFVFEAPEGVNVVDMSATPTP